MRTITKNAVNAFGSQKDFNLDNTRVETIGQVTRMYLYGNLIAEYTKDDLYISNAGWENQTTKERLNGILDYFDLGFLKQIKGQWYLINGDFKEKFNKDKLFMNKVKKELIQSIDFDFDNINLEELEIETLESIDGLDNYDKKKLDVICGGEGVKYGIQYVDNLDDCDLYENMDFEDLAQQFVDEGVLGDIPKNFRYIDYKAIASDLEYDYTEFGGDIYRLN